jgi:uncharacterized protein (DUF305 family)
VQAVEMSGIMLAKSALDPPITVLAKGIVAPQETEIKAMKDLPAAL